MRRMPGPSRRDLVIWAAASAVGVAATLIASAGGARLGAALTAGVVGALVVVAGMLIWETRR